MISYSWCHNLAPRDTLGWGICIFFIQSVSTDWLVSKFFDDVTVSWTRPDVNLHFLCKCTLTLALWTLIIIYYIRETFIIVRDLWTKNGSNQIVLIFAWALNMNLWAPFKDAISQTAGSLSVTHSMLRFWTYYSVCLTELIVLIHLAHAWAEHHTTNRK